MTKQEVIDLRVKLKAGKNHALICNIENAQDLVDETNMAGFVLWDDDAGIVYDFRLSSMLNDTNINTTKHLDVFAVPYESICTMKVVGMVVDSLDVFFDSIGNVSDQAKNFIKTKYSRLFNKNLTSFGPNEKNWILNANVDQSNYDYYNGQWHRPFKELHEVDAYNKSIESLQEEYDTKKDPNEPLDLAKQPDVDNQTNIVGPKVDE